MAIVFFIIIMSIGICLIYLGLKYEELPKWLHRGQPYHYLLKNMGDEANKHIRTFNIFLGSAFVLVAIYAIYLNTANK